MTTKSKHTYVLGTGLSHDGSACLLKDGRISVAIEKERVTRRKHDGGNDTDAIMYCLEAEGIGIDDLTLVVQNANFGLLKQGNDWWRGRRLFHERVPIISISHHLAHAYSAVGTAPFDEAGVLIIDGCGSGLDDCLDLEGAVVPDQPPADLRHLYYEKDSYYVFKDNRVTPVYKDFSPWGMSLKDYPMCPNTTQHSIGGMYLAASMYVFSGFEDPGKLMGLAPYGRPGVHDFEIFDLRDGRAFVRYDWMEQFRKPCRDYEQFKRDFQYYADIAYWMQREVERAVLYVARQRHALAPSSNLAYAGGVALNAVANRRLLKETPFENVYIQPAAGDNGLAVGCAYYGWMEALGRERVRHTGTMALGRSYRRPSVGDALARQRQSVEFDESENVVQQTAELIADGKVVGWFQGGAEFGPRALGHRSILADPRKPEMRNFINAQVKFREDFRPFAPSVLAEKCSTYFDCEYESPYMILVAPVRPEWQHALPSVTHQDKSARIQTVTREVSPLYYDLLRAFGDQTGVYVLLNTSFNRRGMPIVETPEQAVQFFLECALDVLVLDNFIVRKAPRKAAAAHNSSHLFINDIRTSLERNVGRLGRLSGVYQLNIAGTRSWTIDLSNGSPTVTEGVGAPSPNAVIHLTESDIDSLRTDPENQGVKLFREGRVKVEGNPAYALNVAQILMMR